MAPCFCWVAKGIAKSSSTYGTSLVNRFEKLENGKMMWIIIDTNINNAKVELLSLEKVVAC
jgi:hypothetical protein